MRYFGPYAPRLRHPGDARPAAADVPDPHLLRQQVQRARRQGRPCLLFHIEKCSGPCVKEIDHLAYYELVQELVDFLDGDTQPIVQKLEQEMRAASDALEFERAARLRDRLATVRKAIERQQMVAEKPEDLDVVGLAEDELEASVQVFHVRRGPRGRPQGVHASTRWRTSPGPSWSSASWSSCTSTPPRACPSRCSCRRARPTPSSSRSGWPTTRGTKVEIRVPQRGDKRALQETVTRNASEEFVRHRLERAADHNSRAKALNALQEALDLPEPPLRIECYDMSHIQGTDYVGSMVVMEDGLAKKSEYRRFKVRTVGGNDDFAAMEEVLTRRLTALAGRPGAAGRGAEGRFRYPPQLLLVDGGKGQLAWRCGCVEELGLEDEIPVASLAKQFEEVYVPGRADPIRIPRQSEALYLLQQIRDEAHRFAITYHRQLRGKRMTKSVLDDIPGLGPTRRKRLINELGRRQRREGGVTGDAAGTEVASRHRGHGGLRQDPQPRPRRTRCSRSQKTEPTATRTAVVGACSGQLSRRRTSRLWRPNWLHSAADDFQMSMRRPRMAPPVSVATRTPTPSITNRVPSGMTCGSTATPSSPAGRPVAVQPRRE